MVSRASTFYSKLLQQSSESKVKMMYLVTMSMTRPWSLISYHRRNYRVEGDMILEYRPNDASGKNACAIQECHIRADNSRRDRNGVDDKSGIRLGADGEGQC